MKNIIVLVTSILLTLSTVHAAPGEISEGEFLLDMSMQGLTGPTRRLFDYKNKPLIINFWASYCSPCLEEMASLEEIHLRYGDQINFIGISIDDYPDRAFSFLEKVNSTFPHYIDQKLQLENLFGANSIPLTVLIDEHGQVLVKVRGSRDWSHPEITNAIERTFKLDKH